MPSSNLTLLVGPKLRRPEGLSVAFDLVAKDFERRKLPYKIIDIGQVDTSRPVGTFTLMRAFEILKSLVRFGWYLLCAERIYLLVGLSRFGFLRDFLMIWSAHLLGCRITLHVHSGGYGDFYQVQPNGIKRLILETMMRVDAIVVLGHLLCEQFSFLPNANSKLYVVPNSLNFDPSPDWDKRKTLDPFGAVRLLYLSNLIETKGYLDCLEACRILKERDIPIHFDFCGGFILHKFGSVWRSEQEAEDHFLGQIKAKGLTDVVTYRGIVTGDVKQRFLVDAHILVLPTYYAWEGQPISIIEALAFGMPVITTRFRGIPEQVIDNYNGFWVEPRSPVEIADCVEYMWNEPEMYRQMSINARRHFEQVFTQQAHLGRLMPIILGEPEN